MRFITALTLALLAGTMTFAGEHYLFPSRLHAAPLVVPKGPNWRQQMIDRYPGGPKIDHVLARLSDRLDLSSGQVAQVRPILQDRHDRVLALLVASAPSMTRDQFKARERQIWIATQAKIESILTPEQRELSEQNPLPRAG